MSTLQDHWDGEDAVHHEAAVQLQPPMLLSLPDELILMILDHLRPIYLSSTFPPRPHSSISYEKDCQRWHWPAKVPIVAVPTSYFAFSLVCKRAKKLVTPLLYSIIAFEKVSRIHRLAPALEQVPSNGPLLRHAFIPMQSTIACENLDRIVWSDSWSTVLRAAPCVESIWMEFLDGSEWRVNLNAASSTQGSMANLRRLTVSIRMLQREDYWERGARISAPNLTHLHLQYSCPASLVDRLGEGALQSLRYLRLSRIIFGEYSRLPTSSVLKSEGFNATKAFSSYVLDISYPHPLLLLQECIQGAKGLQVILLEPIAFYFSLWCTSVWKANSLQRISYLINKEDIVPFTRESVRLPQGSERRLENWSAFLRLKHLLMKYSKEVTGEDMSTIEFRIVASKPGDWELWDRWRDFAANAAACRGYEDVSCFMDEDVFDLVEKHPHMGHEYGREEDGDWAYYWTGALPRAP